MGEHDDVVASGPADPDAVSEALASDAAQVAAEVDEAVAHEVDDIELTAEVFDALVAERDEFLDAYRRTAADFDNFRKQSAKRLTDEVARSVGGFVERLLPVLDAIEAARAHGSDVDAIAEQLLGFLEREGLERVHPAGEPFDPNVAEAVIHEPGDGEPMVVEVLRTGYLWQGRVLRAAMVKVVG